MNWKKSVFEKFRLYAVTDLRDADPGILKKIEAAYRGGTDIVQLRSKILSDAALLRLGLKIRKIADRAHKLFFVNDRVDLAIALEADGVHLGQGDLPIHAARKLCRWAGKNLFLGKSTHDILQAKSAALEKPDYIAVGPIFSTPTKPDYKPAGLALIRRVQSEIRLPFVAIGGIDSRNMDQVLESGARRIAVVRALWSQKDARHAAQNLRKKIEQYEIKNA